jgi:hypothetical protein
MPQMKMLIFPASRGGDILFAPANPSQAKMPVSDAPGAT